MTFTLGACDGLRLLVIVDGNRQEGRDWAGLSRANRSSELKFPLQLFGVLLSCAVTADVFGLSAHLTVLENITGALRALDVLEASPEGAVVNRRDALLHLLTESIGIFGKAD